MSQTSLYRFTRHYYDIPPGLVFGIAVSRVPLFHGADLVTLALAQAQVDVLRAYDGTDEHHEFFPGQRVQVEEARIGRQDAYEGDFDFHLVHLQSVLANNHS